MACGNCATGGCGTKQTATGKPRGCQSNGNCASGCNRLNVFDWLADLPFSAQQDAFKTVEVSFKQGGHKAFYHNLGNIDCHTGDMVVVEAPTGGYDIGRISLSGELVRLQIKKKRIRPDAIFPRLIRVANERDMERFEWAKQLEYNTMLRARELARNLNLAMKIGDVAYQGDGRKATFYYTADNRVDFRELIKVFAREFRVKIEMRQIGARQEAGRIGGIGTCGRELCCSTWLTDFKSVSTTAARYQNLAINQAKLSGQCGRLKCCLNFELDTYLDALKDFPKQAETLEMANGRARLIKTDIFKRKMWYSSPINKTLYALTIEQVKQVKAMNGRNERPESLAKVGKTATALGVPEISFKDGVGDTALELFEEPKKRKRRRRRRKPKNKNPK